MPWFSLENSAKRTTLMQTVQTFAESNCTGLHWASILLWSSALTLSPTPTLIGRSLRTQASLTTSYLGVAEVFLCKLRHGKPHPPTMEPLQKSRKQILALCQLLETWKESWPAKHSQLLSHRIRGSHQKEVCLSVLALWLFIRQKYCMILLTNEKPNSGFVWVHTQHHKAGGISLFI